MEIDGFERRASTARVLTMRAGDWAKVARNNEAFWVQLESVCGDRVTARVDNELLWNNR